MRFPSGFRDSNFFRIVLRVPRPNRAGFVIRACGCIIMQRFATFTKTPAAGGEASVGRAGTCEFTVGRPVASLAAGGSAGNADGDGSGVRWAFKLLGFAR